MLECCRAKVTNRRQIDARTSISLSHRDDIFIARRDPTLLTTRCMSFFRAIFDSTLRKARSLEAGGEHRAAAKLYAERGDMIDAGRCLTHVGDKATTMELRLDAWHDALTFLPDIAIEERNAVEAKIGRAILERAKSVGVVSDEERRRLQDAASRLERASKFAEAADAFELLGLQADAARCLELGGEVDRLEVLLSASNAADARASRLRRWLSEHELALALGDRVAARQALRSALGEDRHDAQVLTLLRRIEERWLKDAVTLSVDGKRVAFVMKLPITMGRSEADISVRGASVSRRHAELAQRAGRFVLLDAGSRNGTLVSGMAIGGELAVEGLIEVGLGEDVTLSIRPDTGTCSIEVTKGLDQGLTFVVGEGALPVPGVGGFIERSDDGIAFVPLEAVELQSAFGTGLRRVNGRITLLRGDVIVSGGVRVEVPL